MPSLNQARFIEASIDSVLAQDYPNLELIVSDGASNDGTQALLAGKAARDGRLRWFSEPDTGPAQALNRALAQVRGTIIGWLNSDDVYAPGAVRRAAAAFDETPQLLLVYGHGEHIDEAGEVLHAYPTLPPSTPVQQFSEGCFICQPTAFFRRTQLMLLGNMDESLKVAFDFDYWLRVFNTFPERIGFIDAVQAGSRLHAACITVRQRRGIIREGMQVLARHLGHAPKEWVLTYCAELQAGNTQAEAGITLRESALGLLQDVRGYLQAEDYQELQRTLAADVRLDRVPASIAEKPAKEPAKLINPQQLIDQYTVAQHVQKADAYFEGRNEHWYLYQKPFHHPGDCAPMMSNLGDLFAGLRLESGMRVLEFAAGSCWLSRILVQLGCQVISSDASIIALDIGRELFRKYPPIAHKPGQPEFLLFDGQTLALADKSVDRVIVNDAFHHIPNVGEVLRELCRVLKDDGILGMSEPGRHHSQTEASQFEMREYDVIENDFVLEDIWQLAQQAGFTDIEVCPVLRQNRVSMREYLRCIEGDVPERVLRGLVQDTVNHSIFFLHKREVEVEESERPPPVVNTRDEFDEAYYLSCYPDVAEAIVAGAFADGWQHFDKYGRAERRHGRGR